MLGKRTWIAGALLAALLAMLPARLAAQAPADADPLGAIVTEALEHNLTLSQAKLASRRSASELNAARAQWLPSVRLESRASDLHDAPDLGALVNPAYAALAQITGQPFPTD